MEELEEVKNCLGKGRKRVEKMNEFNVDSESNINNYNIQINNDDNNNNNENIGPKLAPYNPTSIEAIYIALELLELKDNDILYDLGCGDGRLLVEVIFINKSFKNCK
jgi:hypothetical protein